MCQGFDTDLYSCFRCSQPGNLSSNTDVSHPVIPEFRKTFVVALALNLHGTESFTRFELEGVSMTSQSSQVLFVFTCIVATTILSLTPAWAGDRDGVIGAPHAVAGDADVVVGIPGASTAPDDKGNAGGLTAFLGDRNYSANNASRDNYRAVVRYIWKTLLLIRHR